MAARNRPRQNHSKDDLGDELHLWNTIIDKIRRCHSLNKRYEEIAKGIPLSTGDEGFANEETGPSSLAEVDELEKLHREGLKLAEDESAILNEEPDDLIKNLETLIYIRTALEIETPRPAATNTIKTGRNLKRRLEADSAGESPGPSPDVPVSASRLKSGSRSNSVAAAPAKQDNASETSESSKGLGLDKGIKFAIGTEVFYRNKAKGAEGEGILCHVTSVIGEGKQRRYEIQDNEPELDENGNEPPPYRASVQSLVAIPEKGAALPEVHKGKQVFALYPNTTTFYKAEVVGMRRDHCRLRFEGEDEKDKEQDVDRRYVLDTGGK